MTYFNFSNIAIVVFSFKSASKHNKFQLPFLYISIVNVTCFEMVHEKSQMVEFLET